MNHKFWIALVVMFTVSHLAYAQESEIRSGIPFPDKSTASQPVTNENQVLPELKNQAYVGTQQFAPQRDDEWVEQCLNLGLDQKKFGCKIIAYKIQWFSGQWSNWFVPGVNDLYKKSFEPLRGYWACFNDHSFEILYTAEQKIDFSKIKKKPSIGEPVVP